MNNYGLNGHATELEQLETPFSDMPVMREAEHAEGPQSNQYSNYLQEVESPFSRTYETANESNALTPAGEEYLSFLGELNDSEFGNSVYELAAEMEDSWMGKISNETAMGSSYMPFVTQQAREYLAPLIRESETMINRVAGHFSGNNLADHTDTEIDHYFETLEFDHSHFSPAQEQFFGSVFKKIKGVVKKGIDLAKKGISVVGKFLPINIILNRIKGLIKPLLDKVLGYAIGKLPKTLQPYAQALAKKFLNLETGNTNEAAGNNQGQNELEAIQAELDNHIAQLVFAPGEGEAEELVMNYETSYENIERTAQYETGYADQLPSLPAARRQLITDLKNLTAGETPAPAIEKFLPSAIMALQPVIKIAMSLIGRQKIIDFLAGLLAKLVAKYVPANVAKPLSTSIVDIGLSAIGFETYELQKPDLAYEAIANTIQETIQNMSELNEASLNDPENLTMQLLEAFETSAANNFPPQYLREEVRTSGQKATWVMMPRNGPGQYFKKYTHIFDISIDPQTATSVGIYRGLPLANFLRDKYGLDPSKPIKAKVHIYEATKETRLHRISRHEKLPGLNPRQPKAWIQLLPLTKQAASLLLKEPQLGKDTDAKNLSSRYRTVPGQRYYYLEIEGARLRTPQVKKAGHQHTHNGVAPSVKESRSGDIQGVINFLKSEISISYYFSEEDASEVVQKLNRNDFLGAAQSIRNAVKNVLNDMLKNNVSSKVKIIHEAIPEMYLEQFAGGEEQFAPLDALGKLIGKDVIGKIIQQIADHIGGKAYEAVIAFFKARASEFKQAQAQAEDGVTIKIVWRNIPGMSVLRTAINALHGNLSLPSLGDLSMPKLTAPEFQVLPGKKFD